jgi:hypothetical protein
VASGEGDPLPSGRQVPAGGRVRDRAGIRLDPGRAVLSALLSRLLCAAVWVEAGKREPSAGGGSLAGRGGASGGKGRGAGKLSAGDLPVVLPDTAPLHPHAQTLVADDLDGSARFSTSCRWRLMRAECVLHNPQEASGAWPSPGSPVLAQRSWRSRWPAHGRRTPAGPLVRGENYCAASCLR